MAVSPGTKPKKPVKAKPATAAAPLAPTKVNALQKPLQPSPELAAIVGSDPIARGQVVSKVWEYIRAHNLQNPPTNAKFSPMPSSRRCSVATNARCSR